MSAAPLLVATAVLAAIVAAMAGSGSESALPLQPDAETAPRVAQTEMRGSGEPEPIPPEAEAALRVDETALRYFASQGDQERLASEIARLRALYPQWTPPADPLAVPVQTDQRLDGLWKLYSEGKLGELRKAIGDAQTADPSWTPSADLLDRLGIAEAREQLVNASNLRQYEAVVRIGSANPSLLTCADVDVLWRVGEAFAQSDRPGRAKDAYLYILNTCEDDAVRLATVQKASLLLSRADLSPLLATGRKEASGAGEFDIVLLDLARGAVAAAGEDSSAIVDASDLALVEKAATDGGAATDALSLGWYNLRRSYPEAAEGWFKKASAAETSAAASEGLGLALIALSRPLEAEDVLYEWRGSGDGVRAAYLAAVANFLAVSPPQPLDPVRLNRLVTEIGAAKDAAAAQSLGWYADGLNQFAAAELWFAAALRWKADDEPSAYGLALMRWKLGDKAGVGEVQRAWAGRSTRIETVGKPQPKTRIAPKREGALPPDADSTIITSASGAASTDQQTAGSAAPRSKRRAPAAAGTVGCTKTMDPTLLSPDAATVRGWCLMDLNRPLEAADAFEVGLASSRAGIRSDAAYGQSLAYIRAGMPDFAAAAASKSQQSGVRSVEIQASLLSAKAVAALNAGKFSQALFALEERAQLTPESIDLLVLRGYAYLGLRRFPDAEHVFRAAAGTGSKEGLKGLALVQEARSSPRR